VVPYLRRKRENEGKDGTVQKLADLLKLDYDTVRDLERKGFRAFWITGGILALGLVLTLTAIGMVIGIPLMLIGALGFLGAIVWLSVHSKEPTRRVYCPYCTTSNEVFRSRVEFACDICNRRIRIDANGEPLAIEENSHDSSF
jgi:fatty acid desaturase